MSRRTRMIAIALCAVAAGLAARPASHAQAGAPPAQQPLAAARFEFGGDAAQVPAKFVGELVFLPVRVNQSQPSLFELDSTAAVSSADPGHVAELGVADLKGPVLNLSGVDISLASLAAIADKDFGTRVGRAYEGTLGTDIFAGVVIGVNYARQTVQLYDPASFQYSGRGKSLPLTFSGGMPVVQAKFSMGGRKPVDGSFVVNTALDASLAISDKFAQAHRLFSSHMKTIPEMNPQLSGGQGAVAARLDEFHLGPYTVEQPLAVFSSGSLPADSDPRIAGEIGAGLLRRFTVIFDFPRQEMILDSNSDFREEDHEDMSGMSIVASGPGLRRFEVDQVRKGTPAADGGIEKGDVIAGVDEEAAADLSLQDLRELFRQVGQKYKLLIERNGKSITLTMQMRRLI